MPLTDGQRAFADELSKLWNQDSRSGQGTPAGCSPPRPGTHLHSYQITKHKAWDPWKAGFPGGTSYQRAPRSTRLAHWWCDSLRQASRHYSWVDVPGRGFSALSRDLQIAMAAGNAIATADICTEIFKWGGVGQRGESDRWLRSKGKHIIADIKDAVTLLSPGSTASLAHFDGHRLRMNSAMTKIYAAADPAQQVIIYDGRVGAALCLLLRHHLKRIRAPGVPVDLDLLWGAARVSRNAPAAANRRDPSDLTFTFGELNGYGITDERRAHVCRVASAILHTAIRESPVRDIENALFMIGYAVRSPWATSLL